MFDPKQLLEQVLGLNAAGNVRNAGRDVVDRLDATKGSKAFAGGAVAGGLLSMLLGGNSRRGGGLLGYGGAAVLDGGYVDFGTRPVRIKPTTASVHKRYITRLVAVAISTAKL